GRPPTASSFLSRPPASEAANRPSGDQKGGGVAGPTLSVPRRGRTSSESIARIHSRAIPSGPIATSRPSRGSRARYTSPIPPAPRAETISYGPRRAPGMRATGIAVDYIDGEQRKRDYS